MKSFCTAVLLAILFYMNPAGAFVLQGKNLQRPTYHHHRSLSTLFSARRPVIAGNWKLNPKTIAEASQLLKLLHANFVNHRTPAQLDVEVVVFPPFPFLLEALLVLQGTGIKVGAQNVALQTSGAYTGEVSASMVRSIGVDYVMLGHSERRALFGETDADINKKLHLCLAEPGLGVILCVGETEDEYESKLLASVCDVQIRKGLKGVSINDLSRIIIAYEPVWAIGTGKVATPEQAQVAHTVIRKTLADMYGYQAADSVRIQYGGSVNPENVDALMSMPDVDGALVGGASLTADSFTRIVDGSVTMSRVYARPKELSAQLEVPCTNVLGESPIWSVRDQALYWVSAPEGEIWTLTRTEPAYRRLANTVVGCIGLMESNRRGSLVVAGEKAILGLFVSPDTTDFAVGPRILCDRPELTDVTRPNDGRVDRQGRFVIGMYNTYHRTPLGDANIAGLYRLNKDGFLESLLDESMDYRVSNCISFPASGDKMYFCDTPTRKIYSFDYPVGFGGKLSNRKLIWTMPASMPGGPDGAQVGK
jgi:triosephosphate isomerase